MTECSICLRSFTNPHVTNCGHTFCLECIETLHSYNRNRSSPCPECRTSITSYIPNYALSNTNTHISQDETLNSINVYKNKKFIIHDNSGSMKYNHDASILIFNPDETIDCKSYQYRYLEANQRTTLIVEQTILDDEEITIYLLNPVSNSNSYIEDIDYVTINKKNYKSKQKIFEKLLSEHNIYGRTPLHEITHQITKDIEQNRIPFMKYTIIYITDGEPNEPSLFEYNLKKLIRTVPCNLIFNLITDEDSIVEYYNDLDINLNKGNKELTPCVDTLDDWVSEAKETQINSWIIYYHDLHKKRMSGADHMVFDMIDEKPMNIFYITILLKLLFPNYEIPEVDDIHYFTVLSKIAEENKVYDILSKSFKPVIRVNQIKMKYYYEKGVHYKIIKKMIFALLLFVCVYSMIN